MLEISQIEATTTPSSAAAVKRPTTLEEAYALRHDLKRITIERNDPEIEDLGWTKARRLTSARDLYPLYSISLRPSDETRKWWCAVCFKEKFYEGTAVWCDDDKFIRNIGHCCVDSIDLSDQYRSRIQELKRADETEQARATWARIAPAIAMLHEQLGTFTSRNRLPEYDQFVDTLKKHVPWMVRGLMRAAAGSGELTVERRREGHETFTRGTLRNIESESFGTVRGLEMLHANDLSARSADLLRQLRMFTPASFDELEPTQQKLALERLSRAVIDARTVRRAIRGVTDFVSHDNLSTVCRWATAAGPGGTWRVASDQICGPYFSLKVPRPIKDPLLPALDQQEELRY
ncbi:MAG: hypothetical protein AB7P02_14820 [Alphaproteobacteria bacterium]